ncbi:MAG: cobalt-precorrin-5B (C(1))-methyltransferase CbiD [Clostridiales bacterium]|jgi:cobalt-precorrin-5B (C1)-methyltransferase|nr:cobalt-precorrin-5B (C(1))-methyltransferase CbiD [Clostridiales bacterium]
MERYVYKNGKRLRMGYTTGACAAAASKAAALMLLSGSDMPSVAVTLPMGATLTLDVHEIQRSPAAVSCAVVKDGGDDPDVTNGLRICARVEIQESGVIVEGGEGVGRAAKPGLPIALGEAAINPGPMRMIQNELQAALAGFPAVSGLKAVISVPGGAETAQKTFNPRLGILGGISILGSTGLVEPMSEQALIATIQMEMAMRRRVCEGCHGRAALLLTPGNYGAAFAKERWGLDLDQAVKCANFIGEALDYAAYLGFDDVLIAGHAGKLIKLAAGIMNTHSRAADGRMEILTAHAAVAGAGPDLAASLMDCATTDAAFSLLDEAGLTGAVLASVSRKIDEALRRRLGEKTNAIFVIFKNNNEALYISDEKNLERVLRDLKG